MSVDELAKRRAVALDAERVGQRQRDLMPGGVGDRGGLAKRSLCQWRVEQITFEIGHLSRAEDVGVDVVGSERHASAEIGVQSALTVGRNQDQAARGAGAV